jgi:hypothetical protein
VSDDIGKLGAQGRVVGVVDGALDAGGEGEIGKSDALGDEEGTGGEVRVKGGEGTKYTFRKHCVERLAVWGYIAFQKPTDERIINFQFSVDEVDPLVDKGSLLEVTAKKTRVGGQRCDVFRDRRTLKQFEPISGFQSWDLAMGKFGKKFGLFIIHVVSIVGRDVKFNTA